MIGQKNPLIRDYYVDFQGQNRTPKISESSSIPSQIDSTDNVDDRWIEAGNNLNDLEREDQPSKGKWLIYLSSNKVDAAWLIVKQAMLDGSLREAKVSTVNRQHNDHVLCIYAYKSEDIKEVKALYETIVNLGLVDRKTSIRYKSNAETLNIQYSQQSYLYYTSEHMNALDQKSSKLTSSPNATLFNSPKLEKKEVNENTEMNKRVFKHYTKQW